MSGDNPPPPATPVQRPDRCAAISLLQALLRSFPPNRITGCGHWLPWGCPACRPLCSTAYRVLHSSVCVCHTLCVHQGWTRVAGRRHCWCTTGWDTGTHGIWGKRAVLPGAECGRGLQGAAGPRDRHECRSVQDILFLLRGGGRLGAQAAPRVPDVPHNRWRLLGLPQGASRELPLLLGVPGPPAGTRPTSSGGCSSRPPPCLSSCSPSASSRRCGTCSLKQYCSSSAGSRWMGVQLAVDAFLAKRLAAVRALDPVARPGCTDVHESRRVYVTTTRHPQPDKLVISTSSSSCPAACRPTPAGGGCTASCRGGR